MTGVLTSMSFTKVTNLSIEGPKEEEVLELQVQLEAAVACWTAGAITKLQYNNRSNIL